MEDPTTSSYSPPVGPVSFSGQRMLAAIVFTDTVGFSALAKANEEHALKCVHRDLDRMKALCQAFGGQTIKGTGDGLLMMFVSAVQAVSCSLEIQRDIHQNNISLPPSDRLQHRIGIHLGDVFLNGSDVLGDGVNIAARLQSAARPGGVCVSHTVFDVVNNRVKFHINQLGEQRLKNIGKLKAYQISPLEGGLTSPGGTGGYVKSRWEVYYGLFLGLGVIAVMILAVFAWKARAVVAEKPSHPETLTPFIDDTTSTPVDTGVTTPPVQATPASVPGATSAPATGPNITTAPISRVTVTPAPLTGSSATLVLATLPPIPASIPDASSPISPGIGAGAILNQASNPPPQPQPPVQTTPSNDNFDTDSQIAMLLQKRAEYFKKYDFSGLQQYLQDNPGTGDSAYQVRATIMTTKVGFLADLFDWWEKTFKARYSSLIPLVIYGKNGFKFTMYPDAHGQPMCQNGEGAIPSPCPFDQIAPKVMVALIQKTMDEQFHSETNQEKRYRDELVGFCIAYRVPPPKPPENHGFLQGWDKK